MVYCRRSGSMSHLLEVHGLTDQGDGAGATWATLTDPRTSRDQVRLRLWRNDELSAALIAAALRAAVPLGGARARPEIHR